MGKGDRKRRKNKYKKNKKQNKIVKNKEKFINLNDLKNVPINMSNETGVTRMNYETIREDLKYNADNPIHFLKWAAKYSKLDDKKIKDMGNEFKKVFPFADQSDQHDKKFKSLKNTEFPLAWFKERKFKENYTKYFEISIKEFNNVKNLTEINLSTLDKLIPYSFIVQATIKLTASYFSHDDDNFYLVRNPCLKEKVFKVPMIKGSGWKGSIAKAGKDLINENIENFSSFARIFGTGSKEYRNLLDKITEKKDFKNELIGFLLFELGKKLTKEEIIKIKTNLKEYLSTLETNFQNENFQNTPYLKIHKGRAIFYPTYFNRLSLEIINPHSRKTRAGKNPIHYEVVPECSKGILQIIYIPYDGILTKEDELKKQVKQDIEFLIKCIEKTADNGTGAKTKLGWGKFDFLDRKYYVNKNIDNLSLQNWEKYRGAK